MTSAEPLIRNISDTARWAAVYRARETDRPDGAFKDPFARRLAGERGEQIAQAMRFSTRHTWSWISRTVLFDEFIRAELAAGVDLVVNLAAGLDARPYRMDVPPSVRWVEVDLPELVDYKEAILANDRPKCSLERVRLDLSDVQRRRELFARVAHGAKKALVLTEGLIIYLTTAQVGELARDLAAPPPFRRWITDLASPAVVRMLQKKMGGRLGEGGARLQFGPAEGPGFFARFGWESRGARSMLKAAKELRRLPFPLNLLAMLPERGGPPGERRPWSGVCLFGKAGDP